MDCTCKTCGSTLPMKLFRTRDSVLHSTCADCRRRKAARDRSAKHRKKLKREYERKMLQLERAEANNLMNSRTNEELVRGMLRKLGIDASQAKGRVKFYLKKIAEGNYTDRTVAALRYAEAKVNFYDEVKRLIIRDQGTKPLLAYLSDSRLLFEYGLRYTFDSDDLDMEQAHESPP
jgi:hypothetical protein